MKKSLLAAAVLSAVSFGAYANGVELYGIADVAVASVTNTLSPDSNFSTGLSLKSGSTATNSFTGMLNGGIQASRWGIKGSEDLGDGMKAVFQLESGIQLPSGSLANSAQSLIDSKANGVFGSNGSTNGELFSRQAWVGLSDAELGTIKFGKNYALMYDVYASYDPVQYAGLFTPVGTSGTYGGGNGVSENLRQTNSVKYTGKMGDINYGAMYKFGNVAGSSSQQSAYGFNVGYEKGAFGIQAVYQGATDAISEGAGGTAASPTITLTAQNTNAVLIATKYKFSSDLTGKVNYQRYTKSLASDNLGISSTYNGFTATALTATQISNGATSNYAQQVNNASVNILSVGGDYNFSSKLNVAVAYYVVNVDAVAATTAGTYNGYYVSAAGAVAAYTENYVSALVDYSLSKRTDLYAGMMNTTTGKASTNNMNIVAVGLRTKF